MKVIPVIHEAALDPRRWQAVSDALAATAVGVQIYLLFFDTSNPGAEVTVNAGCDPVMVGKFNEYYGSINPWREKLLGFPQMVAVTHEQILPHAELVKTEFHADFLLPQEDTSAGAAVILQRDSRRLLVMGGQMRLRDRDRLERPWQDLANELGPALRHAVEVNRVMASLRLENQLLTQGIRIAGASVLILSDDMRVLFANDAACRNLTSLRRGNANRLSLRDPRSQDALENALRRSRNGGTPIALRLVEPVTRAPRIAHLLRAGPDLLAFAGIDPMRLSVPESVVVLVVPETDPGTILMQNFSLTRAEAEVARALQFGLTLAEIAEARGASPHTVRAQCKAILGKCGVRRQAELVGLLSQTLR